jgi:hypothetical protein
LAARCDTDEAAIFRAAHPQLDGIDGSGRPYFTVAIDETKCPPAMAVKARITLRLRWLPDGVLTANEQATHGRTFDGEASYEEQA